jgi:hypothetical protein
LERNSPAVPRQDRTCCDICQTWAFVLAKAK